MSRSASSVYKKIWEEHHKACLLPGIHIHHIDGDHTNNDPLNLQAVTRREHYEIHLKQGDAYAAKMLARGLELSDSALLKLMQENGRRQGQYTLENKLGIHGLDAETRIRNSTKAGKACKGSPKTGYTGGQATRDRKLGIHGLNLEERQSFGRQGAEVLKAEGRCGFQAGHAVEAGRTHKGKIPCYHPDNPSVTRRVTPEVFYGLQAHGWVRGNMARRLAAQAKLGQD